MTEKTSAPMMPKEKFLNALSEIQREKLIQHFDEIYACAELTPREENILYLAYLWKVGFGLI
jgi:hypothetical protein